MDTKRYLQTKRCNFCFEHDHTAEMFQIQVYIWLILIVGFEMSLPSNPLLCIYELKNLPDRMQLEISLI